MTHDDFQATDTVNVETPDGLERPWSLTQTRSPGQQWTLVLSSSAGETWTSSGEGLWTAFTEMRRQLDPQGYKICCAGARVDANLRRGRWASNDVVDILSRRTLIGIRHTAPLLGYAPPSKVATVAAQQEHYQRWLRTPWWRVFWPGRAVR